MWQSFIFVSKEFKNSVSKSYMILRDFQFFTLSLLFFLFSCFISFLESMYFQIEFIMGARNDYFRFKGNV